MRAISFDELIAATGGTAIGSFDMSSRISRIEFDSRRIQPGDLFWALEGDVHNGHHFAQDALRRGAVAALVEREQCSLETAIVVDDSLMALWDFAEWYRRQLEAIVIGVTGSVGKTTTRHMIACVLGARFHGVQSPKNFNNHFGVPQSLLHIEEQHEFAVIEMGASRLGEIAELTEVAQPEIGVVTAVGPSHLDEFETYENIIATKGELIAGLPEAGFAVLNGDDRNVRQMSRRAACPVISIGEKAHNDLIATEVVVSNDHLAFQVEGVPFQVPVTGRHHLTAALIAIAIGRQIDMTDQEIQQGLDTFTSVEGRSQVLNVGPWTVLNDTYNANPLSMSSACKTLQNWSTTGKRILLSGDMLSLGEWSEDFHRLLGEEIARSGIDRLIAFGSQAALVTGSARKNGMDAGCLGTCRTVETAKLLLNLWLEPGDVILIKGSRAMHMEQFLPVLEQLAAGQQVRTPVPTTLKVA